MTIQLKGSHLMLLKGNYCNLNNKNAMFRVSHNLKMLLCQDTSTIQRIPFNVLSSRATFYLACTAAIIAIFQSIRLILLHFTNYSQPRFQRPVTRILLMVPIYAICSVTTIFVIDYSVYLSVLRDCCTLCMIQTRRS